MVFPGIWFIFGGQNRVPYNREPVYSFSAWYCGFGHIHTNGYNIPNKWNGWPAVHDISLADCINHCKAVGAPYFSHYNDGRDGDNCVPLFSSTICTGNDCALCTYPDTRWCQCKVTNEGAHKKLDRNRNRHAPLGHNGRPFVYTSGKLEGC